MTHNKDLPQSAINGQTLEGNKRCEDLPFCSAYNRLRPSATKPSSRSARKARLASSSLSKPRWTKEDDGCLGKKRGRGGNLRRQNTISLLRRSGYILENGNKQKQEGEASSKKVRLADYFDVIAGTSAGALITSLLALPESIEIDASKQIVGQLPRPRTAEEITELLCDKGPIIFEKETSKQVAGTTTSNQTNKAALDFVDRFKKKCHDILESAGKKVEAAIKAAVDTVYTGEHLNEVAGELLGKDTLLKDLSTNIVIPTYDVNKLRPVVFTTRLAKEQNSKITLRDIVVSSASAPYFFPPKKFEADGEQYNLVDGGLFANNPTMLAIREASKLFPEAGDYSNYLILSLGTGKEKLSGDRTILTGGIVDWLIGLEAIVALKIKTPPLVDDYEMKEEHAEMDNTHQENLENLKKIGNDLISRYVAIPNSETGLPSVIFEEVEEKISPNLLPPKNQDELKR
ncbi:hypothetical protein TEA_015353 [Camellia sinensis var. sinensis]|uniref:Patatin n=1 Tax=Camellia sinensis var. sinensis TaxID=542762 RepID=A0A4S4F3R2_CAMSN|nr:hypothetical protein TEA_015353 [Camellia sinensis var. sinensis]